MKFRLGNIEFEFKAEKRDKVLAELEKKAVMPDQESRIKALRQDNASEFAEAVGNLFKEPERLIDEYRKAHIRTKWCQTEKGLIFQDIHIGQYAVDLRMYGDNPSMGRILPFVYVPQFAFLKNKQGAHNGLYLSIGINDANPLINRQEIIYVFQQNIPETK